MSALHGPASSNGYQWMRRANLEGIAAVVLVNDKREQRMTPLNARADPFFSMCVCADHFKRCDAVRYLLIVTDVLLSVNDVL